MTQTTSEASSPDSASCDALPALLRRILVVIDPTVHEQPALEKAVRMAARCGSSLELYVCDVEQDIPESWAGGSRAAEYREIKRVRMLGELNAMAEPLKARGLDVTTMCEWHAPLEQGIGYHAIRTMPDLVVKETHRHTSIPRAVLSHTDWNLIRQVPAPLLLVRQGVWPASPRIGAAVDPVHPEERSASHDQAVVELGGSMAAALDGTLDLFHVLQTPPHLPGDVVTAEDRAIAHGLARQAVRKLGDAAGAGIHFGEAPVTEGLLRLVNECSVDVLLMGVAARPHWAHSAANGTAAQILERVGCDVLVVKPAGFTSPLLVTDD